MKLWVGATLLMAGLVSGCSTAKSKTELVVGSLVPRTGNNANADWISALELARDDVNRALDEAGDSNKHDLAIKWDSRDTASDAALMRQYARELVGGGAKILTGEASASAYAAGENYVSADQPSPYNAGTTPLGAAVLCASCTSGDINNPAYGKSTDPLVLATFRDPDQWLFRVAPGNISQDSILTKKMKTYGTDGDLNRDGVVKVVVICSSDTGCFSPTKAGVEVSRRTPVGHMNNNVDTSGCGGPDGKNTLDQAGCEAITGCSYNATLAACAADRIVYEYLIVDQYTEPDSAEWAALLDRAFDENSELDMFNLADGTTAESSDHRGVITQDIVVHDGYRPDMIWSKALPLPSLSLVNAYINGEYQAHYPDTRLLFADPFHRNFVRRGLAGNISSGVEGTALKPWADSPSGDYFIGAQRDRTGNDRPTSFEAHFYDSMVLASLATVKAAMAQASPTSVSGDQVRDALMTLNDPSGTKVGAGPGELKKAIELMARGEAIDYDGASGHCDFTATSPTDGGGNILDGKVVYWKLQNSQYEYTELYDCSQPGCPVTPLGQ